ncbi:hypothetical protein [Pseudonocardia xishanensis]|uniref:hypothetical protein n=1 Tax=Pseudonocardia xishanensis TaxID=630995 RepID=UPI0031EC679B
MEAQEPPVTPVKQEFNSNNDRLFSWDACDDGQQLPKITADLDFTVTVFNDASLADRANRWLFAGGAFAGLFGALLLEFLLSFFRDPQERRPQIVNRFSRLRR